MRTIEEINAAIAANDEQRAVIRDQARAILAAAGADPDELTQADMDRLTPGQLRAEERYQAGMERLRDERGSLLLERLDTRHAEIERLAADPNNVERGGEDLTASSQRGNHTVPNLLTTSPADWQRSAMAAIERFATGHPAAADRLDRVVRAEELPVHARYLAAVGSEAYMTAWSAVVGSPDRAALELDPAERAALREARLAARAMHAFAVGTDAVDPGWPLPLQVDPTLIIVGPGGAGEDPLRRLATVRTIVGRRLTVVTSTSVTAAYGAEGTDVTEVEPDPTPVEIKAERGAAFMRLTFELVQDLAGSASEVAKIFFEAKANLEAEKFSVGSGTDEPEGIITGLTPFADTPADPSDLRAAQGDLGPRYQGNARWLANLDAINLVSTFVASADATEPQIFDAQGRLLRKPVEELPYFPDGDVVYGDVRAGFTIVDRLGASIEPTGVHFNKDTGVPDGSRGFLLLWRSGSRVVDEDALRLLGEVS